MNETKENKLVDAAAVAERFSVAVETVHEWVKKGRIPFLRPSRNVVRFDLVEVEKAISVSEKTDG